MTIDKETINPKALGAARKKQGFSQEDFAAAISGRPGRNMSVKTNCRYEKQSANTKLTAKRARWLAEALHTTIEALREDPADNAGEISLRDQGYVQIRPWLSPDVITSYKLVRHHYGVSIRNLINAAPWMFTLLAETSLAKRKVSFTAMDAKGLRQ